MIDDSNEIEIDVLTNVGDTQEIIGTTTIKIQNYNDFKEDFDSEDTLDPIFGVEPPLPSPDNGGSDGGNSGGNGGLNGAPGSGGNDGSGGTCIGS